MTILIIDLSLFGKNLSNEKENRANNQLSIQLSIENQIKPTFPTNVGATNFLVGLTFSSLLYLPARYFFRGTVNYSVVKPVTNLQLHLTFT